MEKFIAGLVLGMAGGALVIANSCKLRKLVKKNQDDFMCKCEKYIDEKLDQKAAEKRKRGRGGQNFVRRALLSLLCRRVICGLSARS